MKTFHVSALGAIAVLVLISGYLLTQPVDRAIHEFERTQLSDVFYAEGAAMGDLNQDGTLDVVAGPYWYAGPDFQERHEFIEPKPFDPLEYSDNFIPDVYDFNGDGWDDILIIGFPGEEAVWYENPQGGDDHWERHLAFSSVDNESPRILDFTGDGRPELVFHTDGYLGYATFDPEQPTERWTFHRVSEQYELGRFTHGFGAGDVNGDDLPDLLMADGWWENPGFDADEPWTHHEVDFAPGGAQMYAYDVNGDGLNDVISSLEAHGWGLAWFEQTSDGGFEKHLIMGEDIEDNPYGVRFSQPHAVDLVDIDQDGLMDVVSGKRYWAHGPDGDPEPNADAVSYWFKLERSDDGGASFIPYLIDDDSGVGVHITTGDLNGDGYPDLVIANKKGTFVLQQNVRQVSQDEWADAQPQLLSDVN